MSAYHTGFPSANVRLVDLHPPAKAIPSRSHHRPPQLVQPRPGRLVASQAQHPLYGQGTGSGLLAGDLPDRPEPDLQGQTGALENRPCRHGHLIPALAAEPQPATHGPSLPAGAPRTNETLRPTKAEQIFPTGLVGGEPLLQFQQCPWVILHDQKHYRLGVVESSEYPVCRFRRCHPPYSLCNTTRSITWSPRPQCSFIWATAWVCQENSENINNSSIRVSRHDRDTLARRAAMQAALYQLYTPVLPAALRTTVSQPVDYRLRSAEVF